MKLFSRSKDGGPKSRVWGYFLAEIKSLFSIAILHFKDGSREAYHSHAFNSISWVLWGKLTESVINEEQTQGYSKVYTPSLFPIITKRSTLHRVTSRKNTWVITFRGPWSRTWKEIDETGELITLTHGRVKV